MRKLSLEIPTRSFARRIAAHLVLAACILLPGRSSLAQTIQIETQELVFAHMAVGAGWESELTLVAQGADTSSGDLLFLAQDGSAMAVAVNGGPEVTGSSYSLPARSSKTFRFTSNGPTRAGWIIVSSRVPGNTSHGSINGILTYRSMESGAVSSQVGIPPSQAVTRAHLPFDETNRNMSAIAVASLNKLDLEIERYSEAGAYQESRTINFGQYTQQALFIQKLFPASINTRGFLILKGTAPFNLAALNANQDNWSGLAPLPGVLERDLTLEISDISRYRARLTQNGNFLYGVAEAATQPGTYYPISGSISRNGLKFVLQLNLQIVLETTGQPLAINLLATVSDRNLTNTVAGRAVALKEDGGTLGIGSFRLSAAPGAHF